MLKQSFTYQLAAIAEDAVRPVARLFEQRFGFNVHELRVLRLIDGEPGITFTRLTRLTKFERSATSRILSRLIRAGLVRREIDDHDARQFRLSATAQGQALCRQADPLSLEMEGLILSALDEADQVRFRAMLDRLSDWLETRYPEVLAQRYPDSAGARRRRRSAGDAPPASQSAARPGTARRSATSVHEPD